MASAIATDILKVTNESKTNVGMREYHLSSYPFLFSNAITKKKNPQHFLSSSLACSYMRALLKLYCFKSAGGKMLMYLSLDNTNKRGRIKISKSREVFFLCIICKHLKKKFPHVTSLSLLALVFFS